jgi:hypothetical protein
MNLDVLGGAVTIRDRILRALSSLDHRCDDCLAQSAGVTPRQSVNQSCRKLAVENLLTRSLDVCSTCNGGKTVNTLRSSGAYADPEAKGAARTASARETDRVPKAKRAAFENSDDACFLVSCVGQKHPSPMEARDLYCSAWFTKARRYVEYTRRPWFILSAEYGLVSPDSEIAPYDRTLQNMGVVTRKQWAQKVARQMDERFPHCRQLVVLAGARYREFLMPYLRSRADRVVVPLEGLRIGEQLSWLAAHAPGK